jgi:hypothetical protein
MLLRTSFFKIAMISLNTADAHQAVQDGAVGKVTDRRAVKQTLALASTLAVA